MLSERTFRAAAAALLATLLLATVCTAKDGRDFAGSYTLTNIAGQDGQVHATLTLQLFNYSGDDLKQAVVVVRSSEPGAGVLGTSAPIAVWASGASVTISQQVTVQRDEFERWGGRRQPAVVVVYRDGHGEWQRTAQVNRRPTLPPGETE
jgi:hypothetical protein